MAKRYDELTIADDFIFGKVMGEERVSRALLQVLLQRKVGKLKEVTAQKEIRYLEDGKYIRMDFYAEAGDTVLDAEMQNLGKKTIEALELGKRSRYYQSMIDTDFLDKGRNYSALPETMILFICTFDPFGQGRWRYTFRNVCIEEINQDKDIGGERAEPGGIELGDDTYKIFFNCTYTGGGAPADVQSFYDYVMSGKVTTKETSTIEEAVQRARLNEQWRSEYMKELLHDYDVRLDGVFEGREEGRVLGIEILNSLGRLMSEAGRADEFVQSTTDPQLQERLLAEFGLTVDV